MDVATMTMDKEEAKEKLRAYRKQLHRRADSEYEAAAAGYQELAEGRSLINLTEVIQAGGFDEKDRPRLAVARADRRQVRMAWGNENRIRFDATSRMQYWSGAHGTLVLFIDMGRRQTNWKDGYALVPMVPADIRPAGNLSDHFILWEVEQWSDQIISSRPPTDPYLLKHIHGDLYAVVAEWLLTDLERAVMAGRRAT